MPYNAANYSIYYMMLSKVLLKLFFFFSLLGVSQLQAQGNNPWIEDSVVAGSNYGNDVWYSLENGIAKTNPQNDWDIAFQVYLATAGIRVNESKGVYLYKAGADTNQWANLDTAGRLTEENRLYNSDTSWTYGAFNAERNPANLFDDGWGVYNATTRIVSGRRMFFLRTADGSVKKIWIRALDSYANKFYFRMANLDNSQTQDLECNRSAFPGQMFAYFSLASGSFLPTREPAIQNWDLLFTNYYRQTPPPYKVAGVLSNTVLNRQRNFAPVGVLVAKEKPVDTQTVLPTPATRYRTAINTIGDDWKTFELEPPPGTWLIEDSLAYFIRDQKGIVWKLVFTGFSGRAKGVYYFKKQRITPASRPQHFKAENAAELLVYPNPRAQAEKQYALVTLSSASTKALLTITTLEGKKIWQGSVSGAPGLQSVLLPTLPIGNYTLSLTTDGVLLTEKFIVSP
jgi:hypothetical protein